MSVEKCLEHKLALRSEATIARLREEILRAWLVARKCEAGMTREATEAWLREQRRWRTSGEPMPSDWVPFQTLLEQFETAVREEERR